MFGFIKKMSIVTMSFFSCNALNAIPLKCVPMNNQECRIRPEKININSNEPLFYPYTIQVNNVNDPYAKLHVPDVVRNINVKVFKLMSRTNETSHTKWHETCKCKCRLDTSVCNNKQRWNNDKCRYECKELINNGRCDKGFILNPSNCECECDKSCDVGEYCKCKIKIVNAEKG